MKRMEGRRENGRMWLNVASVVILFLGLGTAVFVYQRADDESRRVLAYEQGEDSSYPVSPGDSKVYLRDLELYGGKANVLATQLRYWLAGLWTGKSLAFMIALFSVLASYGAIHAAHRMGTGSGNGIEKNDKTDG